MKTIEVKSRGFHIKSLYQAASGSLSRRALLGFMVKTGNTNNFTFGGAMALIRDIENCNRNDEIYRLNMTSYESTNIVFIAEKAMSGEMDELAMSEREIARIIRQLDEVM